MDAKLIFNADGTMTLERARVSGLVEVLRFSTLEGLMMYLKSVGEMVKLHSCRVAEKGGEA